MRSLDRSRCVGRLSCLGDPALTAIYTWDCSILRVWRAAVPGSIPTISEQEFPKTAGSAVDIATVGRDWVEVTIPYLGTTHPPRVWSLHREGGGWKLADGSLTIGHYA